MTKTRRTFTDATSSSAGWWAGRYAITRERSWPRLGGSDDGCPAPASPEGPDPPLHLDRGGRYAAGAYREAPGEAGVRRSMGRKGCRHDNAPRESFCHTLKVELVHRGRFGTREEARRELFADVEGYDNRQRVHSALGYLTPEQAEPRTA